MLVLCPRMTLVWKISWKPNTWFGLGLGLGLGIGLGSNTCAVHGPGAWGWLAARRGAGRRRALRAPRTPSARQAVPRPSATKACWRATHARFLGRAAVPSSWAS